MSNEDSPTSDELPATQEGDLLTRGAIEAQLLSENVFTYSPEDRKLDEEKEKPLVDYPRRYGFSGDVAREVDTYEKMWEIAWKERFSGKIPGSWVDGNSAKSDLFELNRGDEHPSQDLFDAALSHPDGRVASLAVSLFGVTYDQAVDVLSRDMFEEDRDSIVSSLKLSKRDQKELLAKVRAQREAINSPIYSYECRIKESRLTEKKEIDGRVYGEGFGGIPQPVVKLAAKILGHDKDRGYKGPFRHT